MNTVTVYRLGLKDGDLVKVTSKRGEIIDKVRETNIIGEDLLFVPLHYPESKVNYLTNPEVEPFAKIPELKAASVKIEKME